VIASNRERTTWLFPCGRVGDWCAMIMDQEAGLVLQARRKIARAGQRLLAVLNFGWAPVPMPVRTASTIASACSWLRGATRNRYR
jgi:hypothetical protein